MVAFLLEPPVNTEPIFTHVLPNIILGLFNVLPLSRIAMRKRCKPSAGARLLRELPLDTFGQITSLVFRNLAKVTGSQSITRLGFPTDFPYGQAPIAQSLPGPL